MIFLFIFIALAAVMAAIYYRERARKVSALYILLRNMLHQEDVSIEKVKKFDNIQLNELAIKEMTKW